MIAPSLARVSGTMIRQFGEGMTLEGPPEGTFNPATDEYDAETPTTPCKGLVEAYKLFLAGANVEAGDQRVSIAAIDLLIPPTTACHLLMRSERWKVIEVDTIGVEGSPLIYQLHVRREGSTATA